MPILKLVPRIIFISQQQVSPFWSNTSAYRFLQGPFEVVTSTVEYSSSINLRAELAPAVFQLRQTKFLFMMNSIFYRIHPSLQQNMNMNSIQICIAKLQELSLSPNNRNARSQFPLLISNVIELVGSQLDPKLAPFYYEYGNCLMTIFENQKQMLVGVTDEQKPNLKGEIQTKEVSDLLVAYENLSVSVDIYNKQLKKLELNNMTQGKFQLFAKLQQGYKRLGDNLFWMNEFQLSIDCYQNSEKYLLKQNSYQLKDLAHIKFLIGTALSQSNYLPKLYEGRLHFIKGATQLINLLVKKLQNISLQIPTETKFFVSRLPYLPLMKECPYVQELKFLIGTFLDKIQDCTYQIMEYQQQQVTISKMLKEVHINFIDKVENHVQPLPLIKHLGVFGKLKKNGVDSFQDKNCKKMNQL